MRDGEGTCAAAEDFSARGVPSALRSCNSIGRPFGATLLHYNSYIGCPTNPNCNPGSKIQSLENPMLVHAVDSMPARIKF